MADILRDTLRRALKEYGEVGIVSKKIEQRIDGSKTHITISYVFTAKEWRVLKRNQEGEYDIEETQKIINIFKEEKSNLILEITKQYLDAKGHLSTYDHRHAQLTTHVQKYAWVVRALSHFGMNTLHETADLEELKYGGNSIGTQRRAEEKYEEEIETE